MQGHDTIEWRSLRQEIEMLIKNRKIQFTVAPPNVHHNLLLDHRYQGTNMITLEGDYDLKVTIVTIGNAEETGATFRTTLVIIVQLKSPVIVQTHQPKHMITTTII